MSNQQLIDFLTFTNETLSAAIVIMAASLLLYNLVRNTGDRVTRASGALLGCVTLVYMIDSIIGLEPKRISIEAWYRVQWIGIAFTPAAMFHLADALLSTTGRISRGRRRIIVRILYAFSAALTLLAAFTDTILKELATDPVTYMRPGSLFVLYTAYFVVASIVSMRFVWRARKRSLTTSTRRRMTLLFIVFLSPGLGIFPYTLLFDVLRNTEGTPLLPLAIMFNLANLFVVIMLLFMAYPLSFFGTDQPDRVVKTGLMQFLLRGPFTATVLLSVMVTMPRISSALGLKREDLVIVATIGILLSMQWSITVVLPHLEHLLIYTHDQKEAQALRQISERLLTRADRRQLEEAILAAVCDRLRVPTAFIAAIYPDGTAQLEQVVGDHPNSDMTDHIDHELFNLTREFPRDMQRYGNIYIWRSFWLFPLREKGASEQTPLPGIMGIWAREVPPHLTPDEEALLEIFLERAALLLADLRLQFQVFDTLDALATDIENIRQLDGITRYGQIQHETLENSERFNEWVHGALKDYWGGPRLAESELVSLSVVQREQQNHQGNPTRALQAVLAEAIESLKPQGERSMTTTEWILYNILEMRFLQGKKVRDVAKQLAMSDADFYRKQKVAIEEVARRISDMERIELKNEETALPEEISTGK